MDHLRIFPRPEPGDAHPPAAARRVSFTSVDVRQLVDEVCGTLGPRMASARIETTIDVPCDARVLADRAMLRTAIENLTTNAIEAMPTGGQLVVTAYCGRERFELEIADSGPGLSDQTLRLAFDPYYTTKRDAAGLGLTAVRKVAQAHHGDVVAANCPEGGAAFTLRFPARAREAAA